MYRRILFVGLSLAALCLPALAENEITVWYATGTYEVNPALHTVTITSAGTFKVQAIDGDQFGHIQSVTVADGVTGTVNLYVRRWPDDPSGPPYDPGDPYTFYGAKKVGMLGFKAWPPPMGLTINLIEVRVQQELGPDVNDRPTRATAITGPFIVAGPVWKGMRVATLSVLGTIDIGGLDAPYELRIDGTAAGSIHVGSG